MEDSNEMTPKREVPASDSAREEKEPRATEEEDKHDDAPKKVSLFDRILKGLYSLLGIVFCTEVALILWAFRHSLFPEIDLVTELVVWGIIATIIIACIPKLQVFRLTFKTNAERFTAENDARKTVATLVGGLAIFLSFYTAQQQLGVQQQVQFSDRYSKAIDQIAATDEAGNPKLAVRVGGLYVLEQIMNSSAAQHSSILEVLCAYVRDNSLQSKLKSSEGPRSDVRVALTILGRRDRDLELAEQRKTGWRLLKAFFVDREFLNAFTIERLRPSLDLSGSDLTHADLSSLVLAGADLSGTHLGNCRAMFADLSHVQFGGADLSNCFISSRLEDTNFSQANLTGATFTGRVVRPNLKNADMTLSIWVAAEFEHPFDVFEAKGWDKAFYSKHDLEVLGLPADHNVQLLRLIRSRMPTQPIEVRMQFSSVIENLQKMAEKAYDLREELMHPQISVQPNK